jgi:hypothetical protein
MTVPGSREEHQESIARRLEELGVPTVSDEVEELASAYEALLAWMRIAGEMGAGEDAVTAPAESI